MADKKLKFEIDPARVTVDELIQMEEGLTNRQTRDLLAKFLVNGSGEPVPFDEAVKVVGGLNLLELQDASAQFQAASVRISEQLVPEAPSSS